MIIDRWRFFQSKMARNKAKSKTASSNTVNSRQKPVRKCKQVSSQEQEIVPESQDKQASEEIVSEVTETQDEGTQLPPESESVVADSGGGTDTNTSQNVVGETALDISVEVDDAGVWTPEREDKLIDLFQACVFLYDKTAPGFQQRHKKDMAMKKFAGILGVTGVYT